MTDGFKIATSSGTLATLESLGINDPKPTFAPEAARVRTTGGGIVSLGAPVATWSWGFISETAKVALRAFCAGASAQVKIETTDNYETFRDYTAWMYWPEGAENAVATRRLDFTVEFRYLEEI